MPKPSDPPTDKPKGRGTIRVEDPQELARVVRELARRHLDKAPDEAVTVRDVAKALEITRSTAHRLCAPTRPAGAYLSRAVAEKLERAALVETKASAREPTVLTRGPLWKALIAAIVPTAVAAALDKYAMWLDERSDRFANDYKGKDHDGALDHVSIVESNILKDTAVRPLLDGFWEWAANSGHEEPRIWISLTRMLEPFAEAQRSGRIERAWTELSTSERVAYLKHAIHCEKILLTRTPCAERAQAMLPGPTAPPVR